MKMTKLVSVFSGAYTGDNSVMRVPLCCCKDDLHSSTDKQGDRNAD
jgi:hypothetical protein